MMDELYGMSARSKAADSEPSGQRRGGHPRISDAHRTYDQPARLNAVAEINEAAIRENRAGAAGQFRLRPRFNIPLTGRLSPLPRRYNGGLRNGRKCADRLQR